MTGRPQRQAAVEAAAELGLGKGGIVAVAAFKFHAEPPLAAIRALMNELHGKRLFLLDIGHGTHHVIPYAGRGYAVTQHIRRQQLFRMLPQIAVQPVHLTRRTGEQHRTALVQIVAHLLIGAADFTLHGLGAL